MIKRKGACTCFFPHTEPEKYFLFSKFRAQAEDQEAFSSRSLDRHLLLGTQKSGAFPHARTTVTAAHVESPKKMTRKKRSREDLFSTEHLSIYSVMPS